MSKDQSLMGMLCNILCCRSKNEASAAETEHVGKQPVPPAHDHHFCSYDLRTRKTKKKGNSISPTNDKAKMVDSVKDVEPIKTQNGVVQIASSSNSNNSRRVLQRKSLEEILAKHVDEKELDPVPWEKQLREMAAICVVDEETVVKWKEEPMTPAVSLPEHLPLNTPRPVTPPQDTGPNHADQDPNQSIIHRLLKPVENRSALILPMVVTNEQKDAPQIVVSQYQSVDKIDRNDRKSKSIESGGTITIDNSPQAHQDEHDAPGSSSAKCSTCAVSESDKINPPEFQEVVNEVHQMRPSDQSANAEIGNQLNQEESTNRYILRRGESLQDQHPSSHFETKTDARRIRKISKRSDSEGTLPSYRTYSIPPTDVQKATEALHLRLLALERTTKLRKHENVEEIEN